MNFDKCNYCDSDVAPTARICPKCGANLRAQRLENPYVKSVFVKFILSMVAIFVSLIACVIGYLCYSASDRRMFSLPEWIQKDHTIGSIIMIISLVVLIIAFIYQDKLKKLLKYYGIL